jgi:hypothetical protein
MLIVPLQAVPSQVVAVTLGGQNCTLNVYQKIGSLYCDVLVNHVLIIGGVICQNRNRIVRDLYLGFIGDLIFIDNQSNTDPVYTGLGTQYSLAYLELSDLQGQG